MKLVGDKAYCGSRSCKFPVQLDKDCELIEIHAGAFILERAGNSTKATNITDIDVKGSIPGFIKNAMAGRRVEVLQKLESVIKNSQWPWSFISLSIQFIIYNLMITEAEILASFAKIHL